MSRIGKKPITVPAGVSVTVEPGNVVVVKGQKATLSCPINPEITVIVENDTVVVNRANDEPEARSLHGLSRTLISNMVEGVVNGFKKELEINGVGYRAAKQGKELVLNVGHSHPVKFTEGDGLTIEVPAPNKIVVSGPDKQAVGQLAAEIRGVRPPEPYLGKGIKYADEVISRKEGKAGGK